MTLLVNLPPSEGAANAIPLPPAVLGGRPGRLHQPGRPGGITKGLLRGGRELGAPLSVEELRTLGDSRSTGGSFPGKRPALPASVATPAAGGAADVTPTVTVGKWQRVPDQVLGFYSLTILAPNFVDRDVWIESRLKT
ncbi:MAG TPA: hypothetical protein VFE24_00790 [Pirellulales bacterium]|nr:hypothetical protein [Pirellulales bacterium]